MAQHGARQDSRGHLRLELWWGEGGWQLILQDEVGSWVQSQCLSQPGEPGLRSQTMELV